MTFLLLKYHSTCVFHDPIPSSTFDTTIYVDENHTQLLDSVAGTLGLRDLGLLGVSGSLGLLPLFGVSGSLGLMMGLAMLASSPPMANTTSGLAVLAAFSS